MSLTLTSRKRQADAGDEAERPPPSAPGSRPSAKPETVADQAMPHVPSVQVMPAGPVPCRELVHSSHAYVLAASTDSTVEELPLEQQAALDAFSLNYSMLAAFFSRPAAFKQQFAGSSNPDVPGGYQSVPGKQLYEHVPGSTSHSNHPCHAAMEQVSGLLYDVACKALCDIAAAVGCARPHLLASLAAAARKHSVLQISCYDSAAAASTACHSALDEHLDLGCLTVVVATAPGLQVQSATGAWQDAQLGLGKLAIMPGYTLQRATGGAVTAAMHRVQPPVGPHAAYAGPRISAAFKLRLAPDAQLDPAAITGKAGAGAAVAVQQVMAEFRAARPGSVNRAAIAAVAGAGQDKAAENPARQIIQVPGDPSSSQAADVITIRFKNAAGDCMYFKLKMTTKLGKLFTVYCEEMGLNECDCRFLYDSRVLPWETPAQLGMEDGDTVFVGVPQLGD